MSHLGTRVAALVDGELSPDAAARAHAHVVECEQCRLAVEAERALRSVLQSAAEPAVPGDLLASLRAMGGPAGPLPPRPGHLPGTPRPDPLSLPTRPGGRRGARRRRLRRRLVVAMIGSFSMASVGLVAVVALDGLLGDRAPALPASTQLTVDRGGAFRGQDERSDRRQQAPERAPAPVPTATTAPGMAVTGGPVGLAARTTTGAASDASGPTRTPTSTTGIPAAQPGR